MTYSTINISIDYGGGGRDGEFHYPFVCPALAVSVMTNDEFILLWL